MRAAPLSAPRTGTGLGSDGDATGWQLWVGDGQPAQRRNRFASGLGLLGADVTTRSPSWTSSTASPCDPR